MSRFRREKIASEIRNVIATAIAYELSDPRVTPFTGVTRVEVTGDLYSAKVFIAVPGSSSDERKTLTALEHATGHLQRLVAGHLQIRQCPLLSFFVDEREKHVREVMRIIDQNRREAEELAASRGEATPPGVVAEGDSDLKTELDDELEPESDAAARREEEA